jgi:hypothetical protein
VTYAPKTIAALGSLWARHGGSNLGITGNAAHTYGYHIGRDRIYRAGGRGDADYSVQHPRDKAGLTNAAAALDLGHADKAELRKFSKWLVARCLAKAPGTEDVREVIYSPDGKTVRRYEASVGKTYLGGNGTGQGDDTHLWHTHISFYRDSEARSKTGIFAPYWAAPAATHELQLAKGAHPEWTTVTAGLLDSPWTPTAPRKTATAFPCSPAVTMKTEHGGTATVCKVFAGAVWKGRWVHLAGPGVKCAAKTGA